MGRKPTVIVRGQRFNQLRALRETAPYVRNDGKTERRFLFKCDCGKKKEIVLSSVTRGVTKSCGCLIVETLLKYNTSDANREKTRLQNLKHGLRAGDRTNAILYDKWRNMCNRCYDTNNENYSAYGRRGIRVCKAWRGNSGVENFVNWAKANGYQPGLELDREDTNGHYTPNNCRFVTTKVNARNRRDTIMIRHPKTKKRIALIDFYEEKPRTVKYMTARDRYNRGLSLRECFT